MSVIGQKLKGSVALAGLLLGMGAPAQRAEASEPSSDNNHSSSTMVIAYPIDELGKQIEILKQEKRIFGDKPGFAEYAEGSCNVLRPSLTEAFKEINDSITERAENAGDLKKNFEKGIRNNHKVIAAIQNGNGNKADLPQIVEDTQYYRQVLERIKGTYNYSYANYTKEYDDLRSKAADVKELCGPVRVAPQVPKMKF